MTSVQTMASPYGQKWRVSGSENTCNVNNYSGSVGTTSTRCRLPLFRCSSAGEMVTSVPTQRPKPKAKPDCEITFRNFSQKSNVSVIKDWVVEKLVNTCNRSGNHLTMPDRHMNIESVPFERPVRHNTMQKPRQFLFGANINRWHVKAPSLACQPPRFADFRVFPCHQFEFFNNMNNTMDIPPVRPYGPQTFMGIQGRPHKQNMSCKSKHLHNPTRKVTKKEGFANSPIDHQLPPSNDMLSEPGNAALPTENKRTRSHVYATSSPTTSLGHDIPTCSLRNDFHLKEDSKNIQPQIVSEIFKVKEQTEQLPVCPEDISITDDGSPVGKDDSDKSVDPLSNGVSEISLGDVDDVKSSPCSTCVGKCTCVEECNTKELCASDTAQNSDVLLIRKTCKKGRPSAKKQRKRKRQKAKLSDCSAKTADICDINNEKPRGCCRGDSLKPSKCQRETCKKQFGCSAIAFILGLHSMSSDVTDSFSEEDDDDEDDDVDFVDMDDFAACFPQCNLLGVLPQHEKQKLIVYIGGSSIPPCTNDDKTNLDAINSSWNIQISDHSTDEVLTKKHSKKVHFDDDHLETVHPMIAWRHAYQSSRKGPWEDYARDRLRFKRRVTEAEKTLSHVFNPLHRAAVFQQYHSN